MDKNRLTVTETFVSDTEGERRENLQNAVDRYIRLALQNGLRPADAAGTQPRPQKEVQAE